jgi:hypothetical protein
VATARSSGNSLSLKSLRNKFLMLQEVLCALLSLKSPEIHGKTLRVFVSQRPVVTLDPHWIT